MKFKNYYIVERKLDAENRQKAKAMLNKIIELIGSNSEKPNREKDKSIFYWIDPDYATIKLHFKKDTGEFFAQYQPGSVETIIIYVPNEFKQIFTAKDDLKINQLALKILQSNPIPLYHEIIHLLDNARFDITKAVDKSDYINSPAEFNAYFQMTAHKFEEMLGEAIADGSFEKYFGNSAQEFIQKFLSDLEATRPGTIEGISKDKQRWYKRIYHLYIQLLNNYQEQK